PKVKSGFRNLASVTTVNSAAPIRSIPMRRVVVPKPGISMMSHGTLKTYSQRRVLVALRIQMTSLDKMVDDGVQHVGTQPGGGPDRTRVGEHTPDSAGEGLNLADRNQLTKGPILKDLSRPAHAVRRHHRRADGQAFDEHCRQPFEI